MSEAIPPAPRGDLDAATTQPLHPAAREARWPPTARDGRTRGPCTPPAAGHCASAGVPLLVDALQSAGDFTPPSGWPVLTADARAWGGLAGVGVLAAAAALSVVRGELDRHGFSVASGSACTASTLEPSHVLVAMGALTRGNVRASLSAWTTDEEVERFLAVLPEVAAGLRARVGM